MISAKILLFGEHILIKSAQALVVPFTGYTGNWCFAETEEEAVEKQFDLHKFADFLQNGKLSDYYKIYKFREDLERGQYFASEIPTGYGLGSSGAVTAAVFHKYGKHAEILEKNLPKLREILAETEAYFHGTSSGIDPLVCYLQKPLHLVSKTKISVVKPLPLTKITLFLLDTKIKRSTQPLVESFLRDWDKNREFFLSEFFPANNQAVAAYINGNSDDFKRHFTKISWIQAERFSEMIPADFKSIWQHGLNGNLYKLKLCGAGGGGFILGMTEDFAETKKILSAHKLLKINN